MGGVLSARKYIEKNIPSEAQMYIRWVGIDTTDIETNIEGMTGNYRFPSDRFYQEEKRMLYLYSPVPAGLSAEFIRDKHENDPCFNWLPDQSLGMV